MTTLSKYSEIRKFYESWDKKKLKDQYSCQATTVALCLTNGCLAYSGISHATDLMSSLVITILTSSTSSTNLVYYQSIKFCFTPSLRSTESKLTLQRFTARQDCYQVLINCPPPPIQSLVFQINGFRSLIYSLQDRLSKSLIIFTAFPWSLSSWHTPFLKYRAQSFTCKG